MNRRISEVWKVVPLVLILSVSLLAGCGSAVRVGELRTETQSVELGEFQPVRAEIHLGAGNLKVAGGAEKLLEAGFTYNVARLKPVVEYADGRLVIRQPDDDGLPALQGITNFRNEWDLSLSDKVPMALSVDVGGGSGDLQLAGLSLTRLDVSLGAGQITVDLSGDWRRDLDATVDAGAGSVNVWLPRDVGVRVDVDTGVGRVEATGLEQDGNIYTNAAYGASEVTLRLALKAGVGQIKLAVAEETAFAQGVQTPRSAAPTEVGSANLPTPSPEIALQEGPAILQSSCTQCHSLQKVQQDKRTRSEWENVLSEMEKLGAELSAPEKSALLDYLSTKYAK